MPCSGDCAGRVGLAAWVESRGPGEIFRGFRGPQALTDCGESLVPVPRDFVITATWRRSPQAAEKLDYGSFVKGHEFTRAEKANKMNWALAPARLPEQLPNHTVIALVWSCRFKRF